MLLSQLDLVELAGFFNVSHAHDLQQPWNRCMVLSKFVVWYEWLHCTKGFQPKDVKQSCNKAISEVKYCTIDVNGKIILNPCK